MSANLTIRGTMLLAALLIAGAAPADHPKQLERVPDAGRDHLGFLYGTVRTRAGSSYTGLLRWDDEESFWDDLFNSAKEELPYFDDLPEEESRRRSRIDIFGVTIGYSSRVRPPDRVFVSRFGDIARIRVTGRSSAELTMRSGSVHRVAGGANDVSATIVVRDPGFGAVEIEWRDIDTIAFSPTPDSVRPQAYRLWGRLITEDDEVFEGFIQWDSEECLSVDLLDGEARDGRRSIPMGEIAAIEKRGRRAALVKLADGRATVLDNTNDVDDSIRGILVEDERFGRVKVSWRSFRRLDLSPPGHSGRSYEQYPSAGALHGSATDLDGNTYRGRIVFDLDEAEGWEILHGHREDIEYLIPMQRIRSIAPRSRRSSLVTLRSGLELVLEDATDVTEDNGGILVLPGGSQDKVYVAWRELERIDLD